MSETVFKQVNYDLNSLIKYIELGEIGLPDIQRPFVWKNAKVRDLFDSMYRGYPVGYLLFWQMYSPIMPALSVQIRSKTTAPVSCRRSAATDIPLCSGEKNSCSQAELFQ